MPQNRTPIRAGLLPFVLACLTALPLASHAQPGGLLTKQETRLFPIGFYELPQDPAALQAMADAGINLIRCNSREDLDRVHAVGIQGVVPLGLDQGPTDALRTRVSELANHPALALWEGPDEVVWNFTAFSGLYKTLGIHKTQGAWWAQSPEAVAYTRERATTVIPNMRNAVAMIREIDPAGHPVWINEAQRSDVGYVRQYLDFVDITGCDVYPVNAKERPLQRVGECAALWNQIGRGKPVYMVLQAFSWNELGDDHAAAEVAYPSFAESRFMAYDVIANGARGILYWGSSYLKSDAFRQSVYALTSELAALQPFLVAPEVSDIHVSVLERPGERPARVQQVCRKVGDDWLLILINEDEDPHMGVVVDGLDELNGRSLYLLYGEEIVPISNGELVARMLPRAVHIYATGRKWETARREGREFVE